MKNEEIVQRIKDLETQLSQLRNELENNQTPQEGKSKKKTSAPLKVGEEVVILNPKKGQGKEGVITKVNSITGYGTIKTVNERNRVDKIVRKLKNLKRK